MIFSNKEKNILSDNFQQATKLYKQGDDNYNKNIKNIITYIYNNKYLSQIFADFKQLHDKYHATGIQRNRNDFLNTYKKIIRHFLDRHFKNRHWFAPMLGNTTDIINSNNSSQINKTIFIHIPKTGGTTLYSLLSSELTNNDKIKTTNIDYEIDNFFYNTWEYNIKQNYFPLLFNIIYKYCFDKTHIWCLLPENSLNGNNFQNIDNIMKYNKYSLLHCHIDLNQMTTNAHIILNNIDNIENIFGKHNIITLLRDPIDRIISEFNYYKLYCIQNSYSITHQYLLNELFKSKTINEYIYNIPNNSQLSFLYGNYFGNINTHNINESHLEQIKTYIQDKKLYIGIIENISKTTNMLQDIYNTNISLNNSKKKNKSNSSSDFIKATRKDLSEKDIIYIKKNNQLDYDLYNFANKYLNDHY